jgi:catechol 2,3-dioxygenase-like lactoylglutathione lyase family enzyme
MFETTQSSVDVGLMTRNIGAMKAFYQDVLGMKEEAVRDIPADFVQKAGFGKGAVRLHALRFGDILVKLLEVPNPPSSGAGAADALAGFRYLTFWVKDMEAAVDHLKKAGVPLLSEILSRVPERKTIFFKDPDGNFLELNWIAPSV